MNLYANIPGDYNVMLAFTDILILLMTAYMGIRFVRRMTVMTAAVLMLQLCMLTAGILAFINRTILVPFFEIGLILLGVILPAVFVLYDYLGMKRRIRDSGVDSPLIQKLDRDESPGKYGDFVSEAIDWGEEASEGMVSAFLSIKDKPLKNQFMKQIHAAHKLMGLGKLQEALERYRILAEIVSDNLCIAYNTAWLMRKLGQYEESFQWHRKALDLLASPKTGEAGKEAGEVKDAAKPIQNMDRLRAMVHFGCGFSCFALKKYELAIVHFEKALEHARDLREAAVNTAKAYLALENLEEAEKYIRQALEDEDDTRLRYLMAWICFEKNRDMECKYHLERIVEKDDTFVEAWDLLGKVCRKTGDWNGAETAYRKLARIQPADAETYYRLGVALRQEGKTEEALSNFKMAADIHPKHSRALYSMASILDAQGKSDKAIECLTKSLDGDEKLEMAYNLLAEIYISRDRLYDAVHVYEEAAAEHPDSYIIHYNLGVTLMMVKHYEEAVRAFRRAQKLTSDDPALYYNWATAAISVKNYSEAARLYKEGLRIKPDDDEFLYGLARISALSGDADAAIAFLTRAIEMNPALKLRAKASHDFASLRTVKAFREITDLPLKEERLKA